VAAFLGRVVVVVVVVGVLLVGAVVVRALLGLLQALGLVLAVVVFVMVGVHGSGWEVVGSLFLLLQKQYDHDLWLGWLWVTWLMTVEIEVTLVGWVKLLPVCNFEIVSRGGRYRGFEEGGRQVGVVFLG